MKKSLVLAFAALLMLTAACSPADADGCRTR